MVFGLISRSPRRSVLFVTVVSRVFSQDLTPASRRQNHTTSPSASAPSSGAPPASTASRPAFRDDREPPLCLGRDGNRYRFDLGQRRREIFFQMGLDSGKPADELICPSGTRALLRCCG